MPLDEAPGGARPATQPFTHPSWSALHPGEDGLAEAFVFARLRETPGAEKFAAMRRLTVASRRLALAGLRRRHPHASAAELRRRLAELLLGKDCAERVYGPPPDGSR